MAVPVPTSMINPVTLVGTRSAGAPGPVMVDGNGALTTVLAAGEAHIGTMSVASHAIIAAGATITRPADTTAYASGDLLANSVTAGSVVISTFTNVNRATGLGGRVNGVRMQKTNIVITNAAFRLHLFTVIPTVVTNGDNSPISGNIVASAKGYLGYIDITAMTGFSDVAWGYGAPNNALQTLPFVAGARDIFGLWEVRGAYTPTSAEVFTFSLIVDQD